MVKIDPEKTWVTLATTAAIVGAVALGSWWVSAAFSEVKAELRALGGDRWTASDMQEWAYQFERANAAHQIAVPDPRKIRAERLEAIMREQAGGSR